MSTITYYENSGFSIRTSNRLLVFDYLGKGMETPCASDRAIVFISHAHSDHDHPLVHCWAKEGLAKLCVGEDVREGDYRFSPGDSRVIEGVIVRAFGSTDQGVSFWIEADGLKIFHAGDFNLWHWRNDPDPDWIRRAEADYCCILQTLERLPVDVAFFPVDPRMGEGSDEGALRFADRVRPRLLIPMHFRDAADYAFAFSRKPMPAGVRVVALTHIGQQMDFEEAIR